MPYRALNRFLSGHSFLSACVALATLGIAGCAGVATPPQAPAVHQFMYAIARPDGVVAHRINPDGTLDLLPNSPFPAPSGPSAIAAGGPFLFVGGGGPFQGSGFARGIATGQMITTYRQDPATGTITTVASLPRDDQHLPLYMVPDPATRFLFVVNENLGLEVHSVTSNGQLTQVYESDPLFHAFSAPAPHPNGRFLYVSAQENLSIPSIFRFQLDATGVPVDVQQIQTTALNGIRITPDGQFLLAFAPQGAGYDLCAFPLNSTTGLPLTDSLNQAAPTSCISAGLVPTGIAVHPSGKFLAVTHWTAVDGSTGQVGMYRFDAGQLSAVDGTSREVGEQALTTRFSPDGKLLFVFNHLNPSKINVFEMDSATATITAVTGSPFDMGDTGAPVIH